MPDTVNPAEPTPTPVVDDQTELGVPSPTLGADASHPSSGSESVPVEPGEAQAPASAVPTVSQEDFNKLFFQLKQAERELAATRGDGGNGTGSVKPDASTPVELKLEDYDYDDVELNKAIITQQVGLQVQQTLAAQETARKQQQTQEAQLSQQASFNEKAITFAATNPNYEKAIQQAAGIQYPEHISAALLESEHGPALDYKILTDPTFYQTLMNSSPAKALMELGKVEAGLSTTVTPTPAVRLSEAPEPIESVGGSARASTDYRYDENLSPEEYYKLHQESLRNKS